MTHIHTIIMIAIFSLKVAISPAQTAGELSSRIRNIETRTDSAGRHISECLRYKQMSAVKLSIGIASVATTYFLIKHGGDESIPLIFTTCGVGAACLITGIIDAQLSRSHLNKSGVFLSGSGIGIKF